ncbi:MAG: aldehyde dehydrogenase family protein [Desulfitobacterium hafniense]|nr:aldehyde dehydrogenase family protein [Desulfitobacterium hafniense]
MKRYALLINGEWRTTGKSMQVIDKYSGEVFAEIATANAEDVDDAVAAAQLASKSVLAPYKRYEVLMKASTLLRERANELAEILTREVGKPLRESQGEVARAALTLEWSAEEAKRIHGEMVPVEAAPGAEDRLAFTIRVPVGVVCAITPFNAPLNLTCHKVGPAIAAGNAVVLKPASSTPIVSAILAEIFEAAGLPDGYLNLLVGSGAEVGDRLLKDERINYYSFTGSVPVGMRIREMVGLRKVALELGSNSGVIVDKGSDIKKAARECVLKGVANAGQVCISVQRVFVHRDIFEDFLNAARTEASKLVVGNPFDSATDVGPMISDKEAARAEQWVKEALSEGATLVYGGKREGRLFEPTILSRTKAQMNVRCSEVFAPIIIVEPFNTFEEGIELVNNSQFGLQAGVFSNDLSHVLEAAQKLEVGSVIVNDTSSFRVDQMPYGGVKLSGTGKEGPRYVVEEMTEERLIVLRR